MRNVWDAVRSRKYEYEIEHSDARERTSARSNTSGRKLSMGHSTGMTVTEASQ